MFEKVVIIDDNRTQLKILEAHFTEEKWEVYALINPEDAINVICANAPDLIITDAIMPKIGGFQLLEQLRNDEILNKIPIIVYSVLSDSLARFYIKENKGEYFLTKSGSSEIFDLAKKAVKENPLSEKEKSAVSDRYYKENPIEKKIKPEIENIKEEHEISEKERFVFKINKNELSSAFKDRYRFLINDEKLANELFSILYPKLVYDLAVISFYNYQSKEQVLYLDIKNFILSPILKNFFSAKFNCENIFLNKKYMPDLETITSIDEFNSKIEFDFVYKECSIAKISFYKREENIWQNKGYRIILEDILKEFFITRHINKKTESTTGKKLSVKYLKNKIDLDIKNNFEPAKTKTGMYVGILHIINYSDIELYSYQDELDIINSKISQNIAGCLGNDDIIEKTQDDEYIVVAIVQDAIQALKKFNLIRNTLKTISVNKIQLDIAVGIADCYTGGGEL